MSKKGRIDRLLRKGTKAAVLMGRRGSRNRLKNAAKAARILNRINELEAEEKK